MADSAEKDVACAHLFVRAGWQRRATRLPRRNWRCALCGYETRRYDGADRMAMRPVHPHMSVALPGYNTGVFPPGGQHG